MISTSPKLQPQDFEILLLMKFHIVRLYHFLEIKTTGRLYCMNLLVSMNVLDISFIF